MSPRLELYVGHLWHEGEFRVFKSRVEINTPLTLEADGPPWISLLFRQCDGTRTLREILALLKEAKVVPADVPEEMFAEKVAVFLKTGALILAGREPPPPRAPGEGLW